MAATQTGLCAHTALNLDVFNLSAIVSSLSASATVRLVRVVASPEREVVAEKLHDERTVFVRFLRESVKLSDRVIESLLGDVAGAIRA